MPETLIPALDELEQAYRAARGEPAFEQELSRLLAECANRPTSLYFARRLTEKPPAVPIDSSSRWPAHNLPAQRRPFIGRENELARLANFLADPN